MDDYRLNDEGDGNIPLRAYFSGVYLGLGEPPIASAPVTGQTELTIISSDWVRHVHGGRLIPLSDDTWNKLEELLKKYHLRSLEELIKAIHQASQTSDIL